MRATKEDRAEYILAMLAELRKMAERGNLVTLAHLIKFTEYEAKHIVPKDGRPRSRLI